MEVNYIGKRKHLLHIYTLHIYINDMVKQEYVVKSSRLAMIHSILCLHTIEY